MKSTFQRTHRHPTGAKSANNSTTNSDTVSSSYKNGQLPSHIAYRKQAQKIKMGAYGQVISSSFGNKTKKTDKTKQVQVSILSQ